ncbi:ABC transporter ATP-binding protein [Candidatus Methanodesulfokora washburnensis]|jgi:ABC-2 type transport system ATP-binding protein|uniref:ABC transporter ATP-binding protein n=1 Tax=Candidatus Methanodesulfokora washburnensis TaxID=2478471 RepID=A0A429GGW0_9CREN|nr:ABC transporter ATP-binding protein [Candidatus Methanodesulfokores washburnensis]RSN73078.1 ABC transporter ATP-binding protein [Candidatus Methanodesulfokores washburnensis]
MISVRELRKSYGKVKALDGVSFEFSGGVAGLIGPNGAGKTTIIRILTGLARQDSGEAYLLGKSVWSDRGVLKKVGVLHEKPKPPTWVSGKRFLEHVCKVKGVEDIENQIRRVSEILDLDYLDRSISGYSAGMTQRISIAACLVGDPELVIMDEPTANLDPIGRFRLLRAIAKLKGDGISFFISSHILPELEKICEHIIFLNEGKILMKGSMEEMRKMGPFTLSFSGKEAPELIEFLKKSFTVEVEGDTVVVRSTSIDSLVNRISDYVKNGGRIPRDLELRPPTLEELFLMVRGDDR